jgi:hypothetical protein
VNDITLTWKCSQFWKGRHPDETMNQTLRDRSLSVCTMFGSNGVYLPAWPVFTTDEIQILHTIPTHGSIELLTINFCMTRSKWIDKFQNSGQIWANRKFFCYLGRRHPHKTMDQTPSDRSLSVCTVFGSNGVYLPQRLKHLYDGCRQLNGKFPHHSHPLSKLTSNHQPLHHSQ